MSTVYLQHRFTNIYVGPTGHSHTRDANDDLTKPWGINCDACERFLVAEGAVYRPEQVPLTDDQIAENERLEREGNLAVRQASQALATAAAKIVSGEDVTPKRGRARKRLAED